ncbi:AAA family ATPase [Litorimonas sp.]|uniref:AAA family ATPase n=1 Tax=Litorimonas sp. TaxID=1892381 RepID=UPI003A88ADC8
MKIFARRKDDPREVWEEENSKEAKDSLIIPPCDLWQKEKVQNCDVQTDLNTEEHSDGGMKAEKVLSKKRSESIKPQCWTFMGARGGCGTTSLAVETAYHLAKNHSAPRGQSERTGSEHVCLIDLDFETGSVIHHLDIEPGLRLEDLSQDTTRIDADLTRSLMSSHKSGISVLATPNMIGANSQINPYAVVKLLEAACEMFPHIILDLPVQWQGWSLAALGGSDFVGLLTEPTIPCLYSARNKRTQIGEMLQNKKSCDIILSQYERRALGSNLRLPDARKALQCDVFGTVCNDPQNVNAAVNCGEPVGHIRKGSRYSKDCRKLIEDIFVRSDIYQDAEVKELKNTA